MKEKFLEALVSAGLTKDIASIYAGIITVEQESQIPALVAQIKAATVQTPAQSEIDKRVTQAVQTAITNYEKKHNLKDGKPVVTDEEKKSQEEAERKKKEEEMKKEKEKSGTPENPEIKELKDIILSLSESVKSLSKKQKAEERAVFVKKALTEAQIPEVMHKRFIDNPNATPEEFSASVNEFKQELADLGIAALKTPEQGKETGVLEKSAEEAAKQRNNDTTQQGGVRAKEL